LAHLKIGVSLPSMGLPLRRALDEVRRLGVSGVEVEAAGDLAPNNLSESGRRELRHLLKSHGLELSALNCPLRRGFDTPDNLQPRIEHVQKVMTQAYELGTSAVIVQAGRIPDKDDDPRTPFLVESLEALGRHGDRVGVVLALETGLEPGETLARFLGRFDTAGLGVHFDPANLLMSGFNIYETARALQGRIVSSHAKDARAANASRAAQEVPLGQGDIDWLYLLGVYEEIAYQGWLAIERDGGANRLADIAAGVRFLRRLIAA
jgi:L-ribulose-5-phosphate 3-epimerase